MNYSPIEILLVEDTMSDAELALHAFKKSGLTNHIQVVRDGVEALDFLFCDGTYTGRAIDQPPRLILLDLKLPKIDGLEVLRRIKSDPRTRKIPVVVLTSSAEPSDIDRCYELGANSCIVKAVDFDQFVKATHNLGMYWLLLNRPSGGYGQTSSNVDLEAVPMARAASSGNAWSTLAANPV